MIANYFYRHDCHCEHCQKSFREHLSGKYNPQQLKSKFKIEDLDAHVFDEIVCWHKPEETTGKENIPAPIAVPAVIIMPVRMDLLFCVST